MIPSILIRRAAAQTLMRSLVIIEIHPVLCHLKELPQRPIGHSFGDSELEESHKPFGIAVICWRISSVHGRNNNQPVVVEQLHHSQFSN